ncbi:hypothetical protein DL991_41190 [Amycolatopsis sp. WAC 01375]|nr:hypothetical protein DL991_41190 [Amycolatopsis sp. WAC 01375]
MGQFIIKAAPDRDLYMEWDTGVDAPTFIGSRAEIVAYLQEATGRGPSDTPEARVRRADETGTSAKPSPWAPGYTGPLEGAWDDTGFIVEGWKWLPRDRLATFLDTYLRTEQMPYALLDDPSGDS